MPTSQLQIYFLQIGNEINEIEKYHPEIKKHPGLMKGHVDFLGELLLGHLRYGTQGKNNVNSAIHLLKEILYLREILPLQEILIL